VLPGGPKAVCAFVKVKVSADKEANCPVIAVLNPSPKLIKETTAAIPIKIPRRVSQLLNFLFFMPLKEIKNKSLSILPPNTLLSFFFFF
jgi:hypothetical protein